MKHAILNFVTLFKWCMMKKIISEVSLLNSKLHTQGGARPGAGRPVKAPTKVIRVPLHAANAVKAFLNQFEFLAQHDIWQPELRSQPILCPLMQTKVRGGSPLPADDSSEKRLDLNQLIQHAEATFYWQVEGDSMIDAGIADGDLIMVDRAIEAQHGDVVLAVIDNELTVKFLFCRDSVVRLEPANVNHTAIEFKDLQELQIWGVVTNVIKQMHRSTRGRWGR